MVCVCGFVHGLPLRVLVNLQAMTEEKIKAMKAQEDLRRQAQHAYRIGDKAKADKLMAMLEPEER